MFENYDTLIVFNEENRFYLTGFDSSFGCVIINAKKKIFITDKRYETDARQKVQGFTILCASGGNLYQLIAKQLESLKTKVIGYEESTLTVEEFKLIKSKLSGYDFVGASESIKLLRMVKTEEEIEKITKAEDVTQQALLEVIPQIKVGMSEKDVSDMITYAMLRNGAQALAFENVVCFGETSACPHHKPSKDVILGENDIILIDIGAKVDGYCGDMTRTFSFGKVSEQLERMHQIVLEAQKFTLRNLKAGISCKEADSMAREFLLAHGYKDEFSHSLGHGIGVEVHERPFVSPNKDEILRENMIISVEPGIYIEGVGGIRIEDIVVIKNDGIINLTNKISKELKI